jgi:hypothetical protein
VCIFLAWRLTRTTRSATAILNRLRLRVGDRPARAGGLPVGGHGSGSEEHADGRAGATKLVPSLQQVWEDERRRRRERGQATQLTQAASQDRPAATPVDGLARYGDALRALARGAPLPEPAAALPVGPPVATRTDDAPDPLSGSPASGRAPVPAAAAPAALAEPVPVAAAAPTLPLWAQTLPLAQQPLWNASMETPLAVGGGAAAAADGPAPRRGGAAAGSGDVPWSPAVQARHDGVGTALVATPLAGAALSEMSADPSTAAAADGVDMGRWQATQHELETAAAAPRDRDVDSDDDDEERALADILHWMQEGAGAADDAGAAAVPLAWEGEDGGEPMDDDAAVAEAAEAEAAASGADIEQAEQLSQWLDQPPRAGGVGGDARATTAGTGPLWLGATAGPAGSTRASVLGAAWSAEDDGGDGGGDGDGWLAATVDWDLSDAELLRAPNERVPQYDGPGGAPSSRPASSAATATARLAAYERTHWLPSQASAARLGVSVPEQERQDRVDDLCLYPARVSTRLALLDTGEGSDDDDGVAPMMRQRPLPRWSPTRPGTLTPPRPGSPTAPALAPPPPPPAAGPSARTAQVWRYRFEPPSRVAVAASWEQHGLPAVVYREPFYARALDVPPRAFAFAGREYAFRPATLDRLPGADAAPPAAPPPPPPPPRARAVP